MMMHNKKRNTRFLFEILLREWSDSFIKKDYKKIIKIRKVLKEFFYKGSFLTKELSLYNEVLSLKENKDNVRIIQAIKLEHTKLDQEKIYSEQSKLLFELNRQFGKEIFSHFIPKYQTIASISGIFSNELPAKDKIVLENKIIGLIESNNDNQLEKIDNIVYKKFTAKFNEEYSSLLPEQKELIKRYISSFDSEGIDLAVYLNTEVKKMKAKLLDFAKKETNRDLKEKIMNTHYLLEGWNKTKIQQPEFVKILKIQNLIAELETSLND